MRGYRGEGYLNFPLIKGVKKLMSCIHFFKYQATSTEVTFEGSSKITILRDENGQIVAKIEEPHSKRPEHVRKLLIIFNNLKKGFTMKDLRISDLKKKLDPAIIFLKESGFDNKAISFLFLEVLYNYPPSIKKKKKSTISSVKDKQVQFDKNRKIVKIIDFLKERRLK